ncbi:hypothetical protein BST61_g10494 [Cercospora zeina]
MGRLAAYLIPSTFGVKLGIWKHESNYSPIRLSAQALSDKCTSRVKSQLFVLFMRPRWLVFMACLRHPGCEDISSKVFPFQQREVHQAAAMSSKQKSKNSKSAEWPTPAESKAKKDIPRLDEPFEKIDAPADVGSKIKDKELRTGYTMINMEYVPKPDALDRNGKPFGVAAEKDASGKAADETAKAS